MLNRLLPIMAAFIIGISSGVNDAGSWGFSVIYETMKELDYPVKKAVRSIISGETDDIHIAFYSIPFFQDAENITACDDIIKTANKGANIILYTQSFNELTEDYFSQYKSTKSDTLTIYEIGHGTVAVAYASLLFNANFFDKENPVTRYGGYHLIRYIDTLTYDKIFFYDLTEKVGDTANPNMLIPDKYRYVFAQFILLALLYIVYKGSRFGLPQQYYEDILREENEYIKTLGTIYCESGLGDICIDSYKARIIDVTARKFNYDRQYVQAHFYDIWISQDLPNESDAKYVGAILKTPTQKLNTKKPLDRSRLIRITEKIEMLTKIITESSDML